MIVFYPGIGYAHFGCMQCGNVRHLPQFEDERPWCIHNSGEYSWNAPSHSETDWTQMVPVQVYGHENN